MNQEKVLSIYPFPKLIKFCRNECALSIDTLDTPYYMLISRVVRNEKEAWASAEEEIDKMFVNKISS
jgi:hypothetical protein